MDLFETIITQTPNFLGLVIAILVLMSDNRNKQAIIDKLIDVIVTRAYCDDNDPEA